MLKSSTLQDVVLMGNTGRRRAEASRLRFDVLML